MGCGSRLFRFRIVVSFFALPGFPVLVPYLTYLIAESLFSFLVVPCQTLF